MGTLLITGDANKIMHRNGVTVEAGTLQIGSGGQTGNFDTQKFTVNSNAILAYDRNDTITYSGLITGDGTLEQKGGGDGDDGDGTLVLTGNDSDVKNVAVTGGTLQIGGGGTDGSFKAETTFDLSQGATLAYNRRDDVSYTGHITGAGKVVQRGSGSLRLNDAANPSNTTLPRNTFTGGTEIENGTLYIVDLTSYGQATGNTGTNAGYITFTGAQLGAEKHVTLLDDVIQSGSIFHNSFRAASGAGTDNYVDLTAFGSHFPVTIRGNALNDDKGGAFFLADNTSMNVNASQLVLGGDNHSGDLFNTMLSGTKNDLYIGNGAEFNLYVDDYVTFNSGIDGESRGSGVLNLEPLLQSDRPYASVYLINNTSDTEQTFHTGTTNVTGDAKKVLVLSMARGRIDEDKDIRVTFTHDDSFNLNEYTLLSADGTIHAGYSPQTGKINIKGAGLYPHAMSRHDMSYDEKTAPAPFG